MEKDTKDIFSLYGTDNVQYAEYDKGEAQEIVIPKEVAVVPEKKNKVLEPVIQKRDFLESFLDFAESLGGMYIEYTKKLIGILLPLILLPYKVISKIFRALSKALAALKDKNLRQRLAKTKAIRQDINSLRLLTLKQEDEKKTAFFIRELRKYFADMLFKNENAVRSAYNHLLPFAAILIIILLFNTSGNKIPAIKIMYQGSAIAYAENQSIWNEGKNKALSMLQGTSESSDLLKDITFEMERVEPSKLSSAQVISESLLANNSADYQRACGIYIDGKLLCATRNESDALSVLDSILAPYEKKADENTIVGFVEEIEYVQGYYPENSDIVWDTAELLSLLQSEDSPVRVKTMKTVTRYETIKYDTVKRNTSTLYKGTKKTVQKGKNGKMLITELVTYIDSQKAYTATVSEKVVTAPTTEIVQIGTKSNTYGGSYGSATGFIWPTRGAYRVSSHYGYRSASISGWSYHGGIDIVLGSGSSAGIPVVASASGTVVTAYSGWYGYGHTVVIDHGNGIRTRYAHMYPGSITVRVGQKVYQGQQIGRIGSTGNSTGPHLHFEVLVNGYKVNPYPYIR